MRWLRVSDAFASLVCVFSLFIGCVVCPAPTMEIFTLADPEMDPADQSASEAGGNEIGISSSGSFGSGSSSVLLASIAESDLAGLAYIDVSCNLGDLRFYFPYGVDLSAVTVSDSRLYNLTSGTLYLYCPDYPDYTFYAARFGSLQYRTSNNSSYTELTGVSLSSSGESSGVIREYIYLFLFILIAFCLIRGCFK